MRHFEEWYSKLEGLLLMQVVVRCVRLCMWVQLRLSVLGSE